MLITEVGSAEEGGSKAEWIRELFDLAVQEGVRGLIWFQYDKETDWRVRARRPPPRRSAGAWTCTGSPVVSLRIDPGRR